MSARGHGLPWRPSAGAAGPPQKAAATAGGRHISNGPAADSCIAAKGILFDQLVGQCEKQWGHLDSEGPRRSQVDNELKLCRPLDR
jgi:hypothetical protein